MVNLYPDYFQECFKDRPQGPRIEGCLIDKQQRINCYGIAARKISESNFDETKIKNGILKCQAQVCDRNLFSMVY
jgi:hypothetical protein